MDIKRRGLFKKIKEPISPPYFSGKFDCKDCSAPCVSSCDRDLLSFLGDKVEFKVVDLGCNFCQNCALACENIGKNVLSLKFEAKVLAKASLNINLCLAWNATTCYNCLDSCNYKAIDYFGVFKPTINDKCIGCGECLRNCFVNSLSLKAI
ncbi:ferredoxin-type protein [Campylobacter blaseri]|uniref:4Fe-4S ferredoxin n=1 Tax=Campylobacter blaseri TaxID=2042961 RepID=A0A2P8R0P3_9BACT|nr:4Fe-4S binding protein [Campylobacter blaseri]PSM52062.1 4Fe-4S ferredoxin [Campylobacter blaseri]PSM53847.1 4Fe-4S ferredoxin [Campylobacter blaseri]QKF85600.1 ferredoxin-type protein [Campylobacter blaseri]